MKITDEILNRALKHFSGSKPHLVQALYDAFAPYEAPPFRASDSEMESAAFLTINHDSACRVKEVLGAFHRARRTLGVAQAATRSDYKGSMLTDPLLAIIDRLAPRPAPVAKSNEELAALVCNMSDVEVSALATDALAELVRRANAGAK